ncbi:MAG: hypothetical protein RLZZ576_938 [Actinomycetota bacterium]
MSEQRMEFSSELPGVPNAFQHLWTPHRMVYIQHGQQPPEHECPFCLAPGKSDEETLIVHRGQHAYALLGHMLVCPYRHIATYDEATPEEIAEIGSITQQAMRVLKKVSRAQGFNIGMNQGELAGAGIAGHLHQHIVPRWLHDANFFPIIAETKALPRLLGEVRDDIAAGWNTV